MKKIILTVPDDKMAQVEQLVKTIAGIEVVKVKDMCGIEELLTRCKQQALDYVAAVNCYATDEWHPFINKVWQAVLEDKVFAEKIVMKKKRQLNRYFLTALVYNLQTLDVYCSTSKVSQLELHLKLERTKKRTTIFNNWDKYSICWEERMRLKGILEKIHPV